MYENNRNYTVQSISKVNDSAGQFSEVVGLSTHALSNLVNVLKTIKYNEKAIAKTSLVHLKKTGDLLVTKNSNYNDAIHRVITDSEESIKDMQKQLSSFNRNMDSFQVTEFFRESLKQVLETEKKLKSVYESIVKPIENLIKVLPKIQESSSKLNKNNEIICENTFVSYLKLEFLINQSQNTDLINGWRIQCDLQISSLIKANTIDYNINEFIEKYKDPEIKKDVYFYFFDGDKLDSKYNQQKITLNPELKTKINAISYDLGDILNQYLLMYGEKIQKSASLVALKKYKYPIVPIKNTQSMFLTRSFQRTNNIEPLVGLGSGFRSDIEYNDLEKGNVGDYGFINYDNLEIKFNGNGNFLISQTDPDLYLNRSSMGEIILGGRVKKRKNSDEDNENKKNKQDVKLSSYLNMKNGSLNNNVQLYGEIQHSIRRISQLKSFISKANAEKLIESLISIDTFLNIEHQSKSMVSKKIILSESDLKRSRNHINYIISSDRSSVYNSILEKYQKSLDKEIENVKTKRSSLTNNFCLDEFFIISPELSQITQKIESLIEGITCRNLLIWKYNEYEFNNKNKTSDERKNTFLKYFEPDNTNNQKIVFKNNQAVNQITQWYIKKIEDNEEINKKIEEEIDMVKSTLTKFLNNDYHQIISVQDSINKGILSKRHSCDDIKEIFDQISKFDSLGENFKKFSEMFKLKEIYENIQKIEKLYSIRISQNSLLDLAECLRNPNSYFQKNGYNNNNNNNNNNNRNNNNEYQENEMSGSGAERQTFQKNNNIDPYKVNRNRNNNNRANHQNNWNSQNNYYDYQNNSFQRININIPQEFNINIQSKDFISFLYCVIFVSKNVILVADTRPEKECKLINYKINDKEFSFKEALIILKYFENKNSSQPENFTMSLYNYVNTIGPSGCGKSTFIFGDNQNGPGLLTDILSNIKSNHFYYQEFYSKSFHCKELLEYAIKNPRIDCYYRESDGSIKYEESSKFQLTDKFKFHKLEDYDHFKNQIKNLKQNRTLKSTANNPESSRGFSLLIIEVQNEKNNKKYYKTVLDSPGLETLVNDINPINIDSKKELLYSLMMWSNPIICLYKSIENLMNTLHFNIKANNPTQIDPRCALISLTDTKYIHTVFERITNPTNIISLDSFTIQKCSEVMKKAIFGFSNTDLTNIDLKNHLIEDEFWNLKIGPEISKNAIKDSYLKEFGIKEETVTLGEFFNKDVLKVFLKKKNIYLHDVIQPYFGIPILLENRSGNQVVIDAGERYYYRLFQNADLFCFPDDDSYIEGISINKGTQSLIIQNKTMLTFFITCYAFYFRLIKSYTNESIDKFISDVFPTAFNKPYDKSVDFYFESLVINELNLQFFCNSNKDIFNMKDNSKLQSPNTLASQLFMCAYMFRDIDFCNASLLKILYGDILLNKKCLIPVFKIYFNLEKSNNNNSENLTPLYKTYLGDKMSNTQANLNIMKQQGPSTLYEKISSESPDTFFKNYISNIVKSYIFNETFCEKKNVFVESDLFDKGIFLKNSHTLNVMVISATTLEKEFINNRQNAALSYTQLFLHNKNSKIEPFKI